MKHTRTAINLAAALALAVLLACPPAAQAQNVVLYDNGPLITHADNCSGDDASRLQTALDLGTYGFGHQFTQGYRVADDFTVPTGGWTIESITFFAYQTGAPSSPSPITGLYVQIWDGSPDNNESSVVWGDLTTNRLYDTFYSGILRDLDTSTCDTQRYVFTNTALVGAFFGPGTYWIEWMTDGSLTSGPWAPPVTILGQTTTGNALQNIGSWATLVDTGTNTPQGMPFIIMGPRCELTVTHKTIRAEKLTKPRRVVLFITGGEDFDIFGRIDLGPLTWQKTIFGSKKNRLKIVAIVPAGLKPGIIPISVGNCSGEIEITGNDR